MDYMLELTMLGYLVVAMVLGSLIGFERELADKPAGMRTHMLVAGAAALFVLMGNGLITRYAEEFNDTILRADPIRVIEALVAGVAFLGAGTILRDSNRDVVQGLTTAATLLFTAAVGVCVAVQQLVVAVGATLLALATLRGAHKIETHLKRKAKE